MKNDYIDSLERLQNQLVIFWGTGRVGSLFYKKYCIEKKMFSPQYWVDSSVNKKGHDFFGIPVIPVDELDKIDKKYSLIVTVGSVNLFQVLAKIKSLRLQNKLMNCNIFFSYHIESYLFFKDKEEQINETAEMFFDKKSVYVYKNLLFNLQMGRTISFDIFEPNQYFENDVIGSLNRDEIIVDAGVCEGYEIDKLLTMDRTIKVHAFEPDLNSFKMLNAKYKQLTNIILYEYALWNCRQNMFFDNFSPSSASLINKFSDDVQEVKAVSLDEILFGEKITMIKMDIEGAEKEALVGATNIIKNLKPKLAICSYHKFEDYFEIPALIKKLNPEYKLYFRHHTLGFEESVIYGK